MAQETYKRMNISLEKRLLKKARLKALKLEVPFSKYLASLIEKDLKS